MTSYKSKVDVSISAFVFGVTLICLSPLVIIEFSWVIAALVFLTVLFEALILYGISYTIDGDVLTIKCSGYKYSAINIGEITRITYTNDITSATASSLSRIEIRYGKKSIMISPREKQAFIDHLLKINNKIEVVK